MKSALSLSSPAPMHPNRALRRLARACLLAGTAMLAWSVYFWVDGYLYQRDQEERFETYVKETNPPQKTAEAKEDPALGFAPLRTYGKPTKGALLGRIDVPSVGISVMVFEGDASKILRRGAGHIEGTAMPGQPGNVGIAAHRDTFFRSLRNIRDQDLIEFSTLTGTNVYRVVSTQIVGPEDVSVLADSAQPTLTLVTCYPFYYVGEAPKRFVVRAEQIAHR